MSVAPETLALLDQFLSPKREADDHMARIGGEVNDLRSIVEHLNYCIREAMTELNAAGVNLEGMPFARQLESECVWSEGATTASAETIGDALDELGRIIGDDA